MQRFENTVRIVRDRCEVGFPQKDCNVKLPSNFGLCWNRLGTTIKPLQQDKNLLQQYNDIFEHQLAKGIIEEVDPSVAPDGPIVHCLPQHPVIRPERLRTKIRVVLDVSAKTRKANNWLMFISRTHFSARFCRDIYPVPSLTSSCGGRQEMLFTKLN